MHNLDKDILIENIKRLMKEHDVTQPKLADDLHINIFITASGSNITFIWHSNPLWSVHSTFLGFLISIHLITGSPLSSHGNWP